MKTSRIIIMLAAAITAALVIFSISVPDDSNDYILALIKEREAKDDYMRSSDSSPFRKDSTAVLQPLKYFEPNLKFRLTADLTPVENIQMRILPTSDGEEKSYLEYAWAEFEIDNTPCRLLILEITTPGPNRGVLFLAFTDLTSGNETYGGGRYLELKKVPGASSITIDFNESYNPYCAYVNHYSCPFPPKENNLKVRIAAGEMTYH